MTRLPSIRVMPTERGWQALCTCGWRLEQINRPVVDMEAERHRAVCARRRSTP